MYAIFFDCDNETYRLPTNPEQIEVSTTQAIEKYEVLNLGQIAVPTHMELKEYSFECEFPRKLSSYTEVREKFLNAKTYLHILETWRKEKKPIRFIAGIVDMEWMASMFGVGSALGLAGMFGLANSRQSIPSENIKSDINTLVLIEEMKITEKAGEEGDKYVSFKLVEYQEYGKKLATVVKGKKKKAAEDKKNPKNKGYYVVKKGDTLWAIAKKYYGDGSKYTQIVNANKDKIKNPNLIYPGWKLVIP